MVPEITAIPISVSDISTGKHHGFGWNEKEVYCWGSNIAYELGTGHLRCRFVEGKRVRFDQDGVVVEGDRERIQVGLNFMWRASHFSCVSCLNISQRQGVRP